MKIEAKHIILGCVIAYLVYSYYTKQNTKKEEQSSTEDKDDEEDEDDENADDDSTSYTSNRGSVVNSSTSLYNIPTSVKHTVAQRPTSSSSVGYTRSTTPRMITAADRVF